MRNENECQRTTMAYTLYARRRLNTGTKGIAEPLGTSKTKPRNI